MTSGFTAKRLSAAASRTTNKLRCMIACAQKATSRDVSDRLTPTFDLNHWRFESISVISAMGVWQMCAASAVISSNAASGGVSRIW